mmetsp:Transcript_16799/g.25392  ORF Transcript_16799/g.25392 Transcript_16799/m.25392 type:complete len:351 (+) Transcript_16799:72-1124(+)
MTKDYLIVRVLISSVLLSSSNALLPPVFYNYPSTTVQPLESPVIQLVTGNFHHNIDYSFSQLRPTTISRYLLLSLSNEDGSVENENRLSGILLPPNSVKNGKKDMVVRVVNANTIKLEKLGLVSFGAVQTPSGYGADSFPECMSVNPSFKAKQLLPPKTPVYVVLLSQEKSNTSSSGMTRALVWRDSKLVNAELVISGMAKPSKRGQAEAENALPGITKTLQQLQEDAQKNKKGLFKSCEDDADLRRSFDDEEQFEALEWTLETKFSADGGQPVIRRNGDETGQNKPPNPGDTKGCSDFSTYEDALRWFEYYRPWYGDVARLDRDNDGIPCPKLPHTQDQDLYRMKRPDR